MPASVDRLNALNIALMLLAMGAAFAAPFHLFLLAYAILGPLHYLTEISWLHDRRYFAQSAMHRRGWLTLLLATGGVMAAGYVSDLLSHPIPPTAEIGMFLLVFAAAGVVSFVRHPVNAVAVCAVAGIGILFLSSSPAYGVIAYLLITIVHVFVFTAIFILAGAIKTRSRSGYLSFAIFVGCAAALLLARIPLWQEAGTEVRSLYSTFQQLNLILLQFTGSGASRMYGEAGIRIMRFIAFAYTYHYLNWFSKTSVIRWHEISPRRSVMIGAGWLACLAAYAISFRTGFAVSYCLSVLHVMLEFPLNHQAMAAVFGMSPARREEPRVALPRARRA